MQCVVRVVFVESDKRTNLFIKGRVMPRKIGFVGMGLMGVPMALNLLKAGFEVMVFNRSPEKTAVPARAGALVAASLPELAAWADGVVLMLTGPEAVENCVFGDQGLVPGVSPGKTLVNMGTVPPAFSRGLAARLGALRVGFLDAPVSGSKKPAEEGSLVILAGGEAALVDAWEPALLAMGKKVVRCGPAGAGSAMKLTANLLVAVMTEGLAEAVNFGASCGLAPATVMEALCAGPMANLLLNLKADMMITDEFPAQFALKHMLKDLRFVLATADATGAAVPAATTAFQLYRQAAGKGLGEKDYAAVKAVLADMSQEADPA